MKEQELNEQDLENAKRESIGVPAGTENDFQEEIPQEDLGVEVSEDTSNSRKGSEEVFPDGPTKNQIENWKQQYGDVYLTEFDSETFVWRTLSRLEYKELMNQGNQSEWEGEENVVATCVLWPENYGPEDISDGKAGVPSILSDQVMAKSGFVAKKRAQKL